MKRSLRLKKEAPEGHARIQEDVTISEHINPSIKRKPVQPQRAAQSYNSYEGRSLSSTERRIREAVRNSPIPITPKEIAKKTGINPSTVRVFLRMLDRLGFVHRSFYGHYESPEKVVTLEGVGGRELCDGLAPRCHKLMFTVKGVMDASLGKRVFLDTELFRVFFFGYANGTQNVFVDCRGSYSFDYAAFRLLVELIKRELKVEDEQVIMVKTVEWNNDFKGVQLDGCKALTLKDLSGVFERLYQKDKWTLRSEANLQQPLSVEAAYTLLKGGITPYNVFQTNYILVQEVRRLFEAIKFGNRTLAEALRFLKEIEEKRLRDPNQRGGEHG